MAKLPLRFVGLLLLCIVVGIASCTALYHSVAREPPASQTDADR